MNIEYEFLIYSNMENRTVGEPLFPVMPCSITQKIEEPFDEAGLHINATLRKREYKMNSVVKIGIRNTKTNYYENFYFKLASDSVGLVTQSGLYSHSLLLIEYTNKLTEYYCPVFNKTKPIQNNNLARFEFNETIIESGNVDYYFLKAVISTFFVKDTYRQNEVLEIQKVPEAITINDAFRSVYVKLNNESPITISNRSASITFTNLGINYLELGIIDNGNYEWQYRYIINVIEEDSNTLYDYLMTLRALVPIATKTTFEQTRIFNIDENYSNFLKSIEMPQIFINEQNLFQTISSLFKYINAIPRLIYNPEGIDILTIDFMSEIKGFFEELNISDFDSRQDITNYGTNAVSYIRNVIHNDYMNDASFKLASNDQTKIYYTTSMGEPYFRKRILKGLTTRSMSVQMTDNNFGIFLPKNIYSIKKIEVMIPEVRLTAYSFPTNQPVTRIIKDFILDLTPRLLEKPLWDMKAITREITAYEPIGALRSDIGLRNNRYGNFYYERGKNYIDFSVTVSGEFKKQLLELVIQEALNEHITLNFPIITNLPGGGITMGRATIKNNEDNEDFYRNLVFNIEYSALEDTVSSIERLDISEDNYYAELLINQKEKQPVYERQNRNSFGLIQRSGMPNQTFKKVYTDFNENILRNGLIDENNFFITQTNYSLYNNHIECSYEKTKNHSRLNEFNGIDQEYRTFELSNTTIYDRIDRIKRYIMVTNPSTFLTNDSQSNLGTGMKNVFKRLWNNNLTDVNITYSYITNEEIQKRYYNFGNAMSIVTPVNTLGSKSGLSFIFGFNHNLKAGDALQKIDNFFYNDAIWYTDENGKAKTIWFSLGTIQTHSYRQPFTSSQEYFQNNAGYPLLSLNNRSLENYVDFGHADYLFSEHNPIIIDKDLSTNYRLSFQVDILPYDYKEYVLGNMFYIDNLLIKTYNRDKVIKNANETRYVKYEGFDNLTDVSMFKNIFRYYFDNVGDIPTTIEEMTSMYGDPNNYQDETLFMLYEDAIINPPLRQVFKVEYTYELDDSLYLYRHNDNYKYSQFDDLKVHYNYFGGRIKITPNEVLVGNNYFSFKEEIFNENEITSWAIGDKDGNLYLACNYNYNGFNYWYRRTRPNIIGIGNKNV